MRHPPPRRRPAGQHRTGWVIPVLIGLTVMTLLAWAIRPTLPAEIGHLSAASTPTAGMPLASGYDTGKCVDDSKFGSANGTVVQIWDCNGGANQQWRSVNGTLVDTANGKCLDDPAGAAVNGTELQIWDCDGGSNQQWKAENGTLVNPASGKCVDDPAYNTANGTQLDLWTCNGGTNQSWSTTSAPIPAPTSTSTPTPTPTPSPSPTKTSTPTPTPTGSAAPTGAAKTLSVGNDLGAHDPSRIIEDDGSYYFWATGGGGWYSTDGTHWKGLPNLFPHGFPSEVTAILPTNSGVWAPDVIWNPNSGVYDMYYAVALWDDTKNSLIGLLTSPTLDPNSADYHWTDRGIVIQQAPPNTSYSAIDPMPFFDANGNMWMSFGSGYAVSEATAINIIALNKDTGLMSGTAVYPQADCHCEASAVNYHDGYYYLFYNTGGCCSGATSTYLIHVARSTTVTGPYTGTRSFLASTSDQHGPGQIGFISQNGTSYYTYHYYPNSGGSVMGLGILTWGSDGWPVSSPQ